jgi:DNA-binding response OmpR family regulator
VFNGPERGPDGFLQKPFSGAELVASIERALTRLRGGSSSRRQSPTH